jgi:predicted DNA-binding transcriptional regulator YafY
MFIDMPTSFVSEVLKDALSYDADGSITVKFRAGGVQEMCWHLFTWGEAVTIIAPQSLRENIREMAKTLFEHHT